MKHTKGPWLTNNVFNKVGKNRAKVFAKNSPMFAVIDGTDLDESNANAQLISKSPDMFNLLCDIQDSFLNAPCECDVDEACLKHQYAEQLKTLIDKIEAKGGAQ